MLSLVQLIDNWEPSLLIPFLFLITFVESMVFRLEIKFLLNIELTVILYLLGTLCIEIIPELLLVL